MLESRDVRPCWQITCESCGELELAEEMLDGGEGVVKEHTWTGPAHHRLNAGAHVGSVAVYGAFAASGLRCSVVATF